MIFYRKYLRISFFYWFAQYMARLTYAPCLLSLNLNNLKSATYRV